MERGPEIISPIALGLISDPPTMVLTYEVCRSKGGKWKRRKRKMPLRDFTDKTNVKRCAFNLRQRHVRYLSSVMDVTLEKMLRVIQEIQKGNSVETSLEVVNKEFSVDPDEDLNKLSPAQLAQRKAMMDEMFSKNLVKPGDPGYVYDKVIEFENVGEGAQNEWDEGDEGDDDVQNATENKNDPTEAKNSLDVLIKEAPVTIAVAGESIESVMDVLSEVHSVLSNADKSNEEDNEDEEKNKNSMAEGEAMYKLDEESKIEPIEVKMPSELEEGNDYSQSFEQQPSEENKDDIEKLNSAISQKKETSRIESLHGPQVQSRPSLFQTEASEKDKITGAGVHNQTDTDDSLDNIEEALETMETCATDDEDEDFWK